MTQSIIQLVCNGLDQKILEIEEVLERLRADRALLNPTMTRESHLVFNVRMISLWADEGEKEVEKEGYGPLEDLIKAAEDEFLEKNNRSDIQAEYQVAVCLVKGSIFQIPEEHWEKFTNDRRSK